MWQYKSEFVKYVLIGILGVALDFAAFYILKRMGINILITQWFAALAGFTHNHLWHHFYVFQHNQKLPKTYTFSLIVSLVSVVLSGPALVFLQNIIGSLYLSKIFLILVTGLVLFWVRKTIIFRFY